MSTGQQRDELRSLIEHCTRAEIRALGIEALRQLRGIPAISMHGHLGRELVPLLAQSAGQDLEPGRINGLAEPFIDCQAEPWLQEFSEFLWWLVRMGFAVPHGAQPANLTSIRLTQEGQRVLAGTHEHPLLPGSIERLRSRSPNVPDETLAHLVDARSCYEHGLLRPAVVLLGLAYEQAVESVVNGLVAAKVLPDTALQMRAARRVEAVKGTLQKPKGSAPAELRAHFARVRAYDFADSLRDRRNDASHTTPLYGFDSAEEVEELFVSSVRHLPALLSAGP